MLSSRRITRSETERTFARLLSRHKLKFRQNAIICGYEVDFLISPDIVVEVHGYHHCQRVVMAKDKTKKETLERAGYLVLEFWCNEIRYIPKDCIRRLESTIQERVQTARPVHLLAPWQLELGLAYGRVRMGG